MWRCAAFSISWRLVRLGGGVLRVPSAVAACLLAIGRSDAHGWGTECAVTADGASWYSANYAGSSYFTPGDDCGSGKLASSGGSHTVTGCSRRVLARCP